MSTPVRIYLLCFNEIILLPHTIAHYRKYLPHAEITVIDNLSTDGSTELAVILGCTVLPFSSDNCQNEFIQCDLKNNAWKNTTGNAWIIIADMDEWLCISHDDLSYEESQQTTVINTYGFDVFGESKRHDLSDIDLHSLHMKTENQGFGIGQKRVCFRIPEILEMNYNIGGHQANPTGLVRVSDKVYTLKHMSNLGLPYLLNKIKLRYERTEIMRLLGYDGHYTNNIALIKDNFEHCRHIATPF